MSEFYILVMYFLKKELFFVLKYISIVILRVYICVCVFDDLNTKE